MDKRGTIEETVIFIFRFFVLLFVLFVIYLIIGTRLSREIRVNEAQERALMSNIVYSDCVLFSEDGNKYPGIIDVEKFNKINNCFDINEYSNQGFIAKLVDLNENEIATEKVNQRIADLSYGCSIKEKSFSCLYDDLYVLYFKDGLINRGILRMIIVLKNE